jgi:cytochrome c553
MTRLITILLRCGSCHADEQEPLPGTAAPQILDQVVRDALLEQGRGQQPAGIIG